jgi:hypothetical protein
MSAPIRAEIFGFDRCEAEGHTVKASAPVLAMCRELIAAGFDPGRPLQAYRGNVLCLKVRSIGEGAMLDCQDGGGFRLREPRPFDKRGRHYPDSHTARTPLPQGSYTVVPDKDWPGMYCVRRPDGSLADMVNLTRAKDAARVFAEQAKSEAIAA